MRRALSVRLAFAAVVLLAAALPAAHASGSRQTAQTLTVYAVPSTVQFMNHADDRLRGMSSNPFNLKAQAVIFNDNGKEKGNGPFPGDDILYAFKLFSDANRTQPNGTAIFTCYYGFGKRATCDSYFDLSKGLVLASGQVQFGSNHFTLGVTGGTKAYLGALGQLNAVPAAKNAQRFDLQVTNDGKMSRRLSVALVAVAFAATAAVPVAQATTQASRSVVFYAKPTRAQFISHADDRERGNFTNPFADELPTPPNANTGKEGARAGDNALFTLKLYSDAKLTRPVGTAAYSCTVNFGQQAVCEGQFALTAGGTGTMVALGPADLKSGDWVLPVTGGTGRYRGAHGQVTSTAASKKTNTQILRFQLVA